MTEYLTADDVLEAHAAVIVQSGGADGLRDRGALESAVAQPMMTFAGQELYATIEEKASALGYSLILNHPFVDGNKRIGHAAMATFLRLDRYGIRATVDDQEQVILAVAAGQLKRDDFTEWLRSHVEELPAN